MTIQEAGKAVGGFFDIMRSQPLALALVITNFALLAYIFWTGTSAMDQVFKANMEAQKLLSKCAELDLDQLTLMIKAQKP